MLAHRLRRWPNIGTALGECPVFAGYGEQYKVVPEMVIIKDQEPNYAVSRRDVQRNMHQRNRPQIKQDHKRNTCFFMSGSEEILRTCGQLGID